MKGEAWTTVNERPCFGKPLPPSDQKSQGRQQHIHSVSRGSVACSCTQSAIGTLMTRMGTHSSSTPYDEVPFLSQSSQIHPSYDSRCQIFPLNDHQYQCLSSRAWTILITLDMSTSVSRMPLFSHHCCSLGFSVVSGWIPRWPR